MSAYHYVPPLYIRLYIMESKKKKFVIQEYASSVSKANPLITNVTRQSAIMYCICKLPNSSTASASLECLKCHNITHGCLQPIPNRLSEKYQCAKCISRSMDLIWKVKDVLLESYWKTDNIFIQANVVNFQFDIKSDEIKNNIQIRGLMGSRVGLQWPMQGQFFLNNTTAPFFQLKPLLSNSNRKNRKQEFVSLPPSQLCIGKNILRFKIIALDRNKFTSKYQYQEKGVYYLSINWVQKLKKQDVVRNRLKEGRLQKQDSLKLLKSLNESKGTDVIFGDNKINLICPYTLTRIKIPIRGKYCKHFTTICLQTLYLTQQNSRTWNCPICQSKITEPIVDIWILEMLNDNQNGVEVNISEDGTYQWVKEECQDELSDSESQKSAKMVAQSKEDSIVQKLKKIEISKDNNKGNESIEIIEISEGKNQLKQKYVEKPASKPKDIKEIKETKPKPAKQEINIVKEINIVDLDLDDPLAKESVIQLKKSSKMELKQRVKEERLKNQQIQETALAQKNQPPQPQSNKLNSSSRPNDLPIRNTMPSFEQTQPKLPQIRQQKFFYEQVKEIIFKEMRLQDLLRRNGYKTVGSSHKKYMNQELKKIFKDVL